MNNQSISGQKNVKWGKLLIYFCVDVILSICCYETLFRNSFGSDTLFHLYQPLISINSFISDGRPAAWLLNRVLYSAGFVTTDHYYVCLIVFLLLWAASILQVQQMFMPLTGQNRDYSKGHDSSKRILICTDCNEIFVFFVSAAAFLNVFSMEYFMFPECWFVFPFGYFFTTSGAMLLSKRHAISGLILTAVGCLFYQPAGIAAAILLGSLWAISDQMKFSWRLFWKEVFFSIFVVGVCASGLAVLNLLSSMGVVESSHKAQALSSMDFSNITLILADLQHGWWKVFRDNRDLLPVKWICAILWLYTLGGTVIHFVKHREWNRILTLVLLQLMYFLLISAYPVASGSWFPRIIFPFYMALSMTAMAYVVLDPETSHNFFRGSFHIGVIVVFLIVQLVTCSLIGSERQTSNTLDMVSARSVLRQIERNEAGNGTKVTKLGTCIDANCSRYYYFLRWHTDQINERTMAVVPYSLMHMVAGEEGREFEQTTVPDDIYQEYFAGKDWDTLMPDQQVVVLGDTAYWCIY